MSKSICIAIFMSVLPCLCFGYSAEYTRLVREKQEKMAELEKCMGTTKGLKIAGVSTLGLTAIGIYKDIDLKKEADKYEAKVNRYENKIQVVQGRIDAVKDHKAKDAEQSQQPSSNMPKIPSVPGNPPVSTDEGTEDVSVNEDASSGTKTTEDLSENGLSFVAMDLRGVDCVVEQVDDEKCDNMEDGAWVVNFSKYTVKGTSICADNSADKLEVGEPQGGTGGGCWCQENEKLRWMYLADYGMDCQDECAYQCAKNVFEKQDVRHVMFGDDYEYRDRY